MDKRSINLTLSSGIDKNKRIIEISEKSNYKLTLIEGLESSDIEVNLCDNCQYDGKIVDNKRISSRSIDISGEYKGRNMQKERENLISFFNPRNTGTLLITLNENDEGITREIEYEIESFKIVQENIYAPLDFKISLICPDPFFKDRYETEKTIAVWEGGLQFPFSLPLEFRHKTEEEEKQGAVLNVLGHVDTPLEIEFEGPAKNPCITNVTSGEFIKINKEIKEDEILYINTAYGKKQVRIINQSYNKNAFNYIDLTSTFFSLSPGENKIKYSNDDVKLVDQNVTIRYKNRYLGI